MLCKQVKWVPIAKWCHLEWITHRTRTVNKPIWCCVRTWRMLNIWTASLCKPRQPRESTESKSITTSKLGSLHKEILLPQLPTQTMGPEMFKSTLFLTFWHSISRSTTRVMKSYDDDDDVRSPITSLLPTNIPRDERIATRERSLFTFNLSFSRLIPVRFFMNQVKRLSTLFANRILRSMPWLLALILLSVCLRIKHAY